MKTRMCRLEFGINCLADVRLLYYAWDRLWSVKGEVPLVYVTIEDRLPGERVNINFQASSEMLDRFLGILEKGGLKFSREELIPGFLIMCRVDKDRSGLLVIGANDGHGPDNGPEK
jgi:hypothetical protein